MTKFVKERNFIKRKKMQLKGICFMEMTLALTYLKKFGPFFLNCGKIKLLFFKFCH